ncbi:MAG TPA: hypothetical protein VJ596_00510 [Gemmatimonadaceae bacterium]|nr:hypothetical protein [Gemmatimonadaceae bacterium]
MRAFVVGLALALTTISLPACSGGGQQQPGQTPAPQADAHVRVENRNFLDHNVYVIRGSQRIRLGTVTGNSTATFRIPPTMIHGASTLSFQADPIGGSRAPISNEISVLPGDTVTLVIPA